MPFEFAEHPRTPETQAPSNGGAQPRGNIVGIDLADALEVVPPAALMRRRQNIWFWLGVALLLGGLIALILVGLTTD
jgi:hypothetical protein